MTTKAERMEALSDKWNVAMECDDGWVDILEGLAKDLEPYPWVLVEQVKEKYGTLRFYWGIDFEGFEDGAPEEEFDTVMKLVDDAEAVSSVTCEQTGGPGILMKRKPGSWYKTLDPMIAGPDWVPA